MERSALQGVHTSGDNIVLNTRGDGRCLFRAVVRQTCDSLLADCPRAINGAPSHPSLAAEETGRADELRARVVELMQSAGGHHLLAVGMGTDDDPIPLVEDEGVEAHIARVSNETEAAGDPELFLISAIIGRNIGAWFPHAGQQYCYVYGRHAGPPTVHVHYSPGHWRVCVPAGVERLRGQSPWMKRECGAGNVGNCGRATMTLRDMTSGLWQMN